MSQVETPAVNLEGNQREQMGNRPRQLALIFAVKFNRFDQY